MINDITGKSPAQLCDIYRGFNSEWLRANMILTLDGNYVDSSGSSRGLSCESDLSLMLTLRAMSDAVLVGASTARKENYSIPRSRVEFSAISDESPRLCVVSAHLNLADGLRMFQDENHKPILITSQSSDEKWSQNLARLSKKADVIVIAETLTGSGIVGSLHNLFLRNIVCEGGPSLLALLQQDCLIDELDLTFAPVISGLIPKLPALGNKASEWRCESLLRDDDHIFTRFIRIQMPESSNSLNT